MFTKHINISFKMIRNGFILDPPRELKPDIKLSPFSTEFLGRNIRLPESESIEHYFDDRFSGRTRCYTRSGREALNLALGFYRLEKEDFVTIYTTTGNRYVSGCVTREVEKFCGWSRRIESRTKVILVIHEFGMPFNDLDKLKEHNLPIIEDCAYSFFSADMKCLTGNTGDFVIYSFPKIFPVQAGGLLLSNTGTIPSFTIEASFLRYLKNTVSAYIKEADRISQQRLLNYNCLKTLFSSINMSERFEITKGIIPGVFMFRSDNLKINLQGLKDFLSGNGIECSVFYGEESFFIPVHQNLTEEIMLYMFEAIKYFISKDHDNS